MGRSRRLLAALAAAALLPVTLAPAYADGSQVRGTGVACPPDRVSTSEANGYGDTAGTTFEREINCLNDYDVAYGRSAGAYAPAEPVSRRQMALFLSRVLVRAELAAAGPAPAFTDIGHVDPGTRAAIEAVAARGIAGGKGDGRFAPEELVTRGQMARFLNQTHRVLAGEAFRPVTHMFDDPLGTHMADIEAIAYAGLAGGVAPRQYAPDRPVTRGQMAGFLGRLLDLEVDDGHVAWAYSEDGRIASYTSTGVACTIVGTNGDDELTGTPGRDVMCGRGGFDRLSGGGADDLLDGGTGVDELAGGPGNDELLGGAGDDTLAGQDGDDVLRGEEHDDSLDGGGGTDVVDGGSGSNRCPPSDDDRRSCFWDETPPTAVSIEVSPSTVDVTAADAVVTLRMRLQDDQGVSSVSVMSHLADADGNYGRLGPFFEQPSLVSGTAQDGIWESTGLARRYSEPGLYSLEVRVGDVVGRGSWVDFADRVEVLDANPDRTPPVVVSTDVRAASGAFPLDVRSGSADVVVEARITDDLSGVALYEPGTGGQYAPPLVCLDHPTPDGGYAQAGGCAWTELISGDARDGVHRATYTVPQGSAGGDWNIRLRVSDRVGSAPPNDTSWLGPDLYQRWLDAGAAEPHTHPLPDGAGRVPVRSHEAAGSGPSVTEATVSPAELDSRYEEHLVSVSVRAVDPDGDMRSVHASLTSDGSAGSPSFARAGTFQVSGDGADGWWRADFVVPQGTPPGTYYLQVGVQDAAGNATSYSSRLRPGAGSGELFLPGDGTVTVTS